MKYIYIPLLLALLSGLRISILPEIELILVLFLFFYNGLSLNTLIFIVAVLTTHHYAIPDHDLRFINGNYPSFYTKTFYGIKILDIFTIIFFVISSYRIKNIYKIFTSGKLPFIFIIISLVGIIPNNQDSFDSSMFLFLVRNYLLLISFYLSSSEFKLPDFTKIAKTAIFGWGFKMFFSIIFPHPNPLTREIFNFDGTIFFAGDEYATIGIYLSIIILLKGNLFVKKKYGKFILFVFILCLIAQRKGAIPYFGFIFLLLNFANNINKQRIFNHLFFLFDWIVLFFVLFIVSFNNDLLTLAFYEYTSLAYSAIDSIEHIRVNDIYHFVFGLGPFGKYEIKNLSELADHPMSFGEEVGNKFRYAIWNIPYGRSLVNIGVFGSILLIMNFFKSARKYNSAYFYIYFQIVLSMTFLVITPVGSIAIGLALAFILNPQFSNQYNNK